jgi:tRNA dimethylallyltransferase
MLKKIITIVGPTGIGKTDLSLKLAEHFKTEIISADSRQFFKEIPIGTAAPTAKELQRVKHHFIHHKSIKESYNVGDFETEAINCITQLHFNNDVLIVVGGSGLYVKAITEGLDAFPQVDSSIRKTLNTILETEGLKPLQQELKNSDPISYVNLDLNNPHRVIRALEICRGTGRPFSGFLNNKTRVRNFEAVAIGLTADRDVVYNRINLRVDQMMENGLLDEVKSVYLYNNLNALNTVGYKELFKYLDNQWTLEFAVSEIKKNTRRFAKRQFTWFNKQPNTKWFNYNDEFSTIIAYLESVL